MTIYKLVALYKVHKQYNPDKFKQEEQENDIDMALGGL